MENKQVFITNGDGIFKLENSSVRVIPKLESAVYELQRDERTGTLFLKHFKNTFEFSFQKYPLDEDFVKHVLARYPTMKKSMGILLNGVKGSGKSVIAKTIANELGLPVIIINRYYPGMAEFIADLPSPCTIFLDEFEKFVGNSSEDYSESDSTHQLLSLMDGVYTGTLAHVFLLTTNTLDFDQNLLSRPGRILYIRSYKNLENQFIEHYVDANLQRPEYKEELFREIDRLNTVTIDCIKALVDEVNIMNVSPSKAREYLNIQSAASLLKTLFLIEKPETCRSFSEFKKLVEKEEKAVSYHCMSSSGVMDYTTLEYTKEDADSEMEKSTFEESPTTIKNESTLETCGIVFVTETIVPSDIKVGVPVTFDRTSSRVYYMPIEVHEGGKYILMDTREYGNKHIWFYFKNPEGEPYRLINSLAF